MKKIIIFGIMLLMISLVNATEWYYPLSNYTGTGPSFVSNGVGLSFVDGVIGQAAQGINLGTQRMYINTGENYTFETLTVSFWVNPAISGASKKLFFIQEYPTTFNTILCVNRIGYIDCYISNSILTASILNNQWSYITLVSDGVNISLYVNGIIQDTKLNIASFSFTDMRVGIMGYTDGTNDFGSNYQGKMDELHIFFNESKDFSWILQQYEAIYPPCNPSWVCTRCEVNRCTEATDGNNCGQDYNNSLDCQVQGGITLTATDTPVGTQISDTKYLVPSNITETETAKITRFNFIQIIINWILNLFKSR
jgi:hypothetical protein